MSEKNIDNLYDKKSLQIMKIAEESLERGVNRIVEIKNFAGKAGIKRIGIAHCVAFSKEAQIVKQFLSADFEVLSVDCKCGHITKDEMLGLQGNGIMCNPGGQAKFLEENNTELNISIGLCVGHDMVFNQRSVAPVTVLFVKDRENRNNPMNALNSISSNK